MLFLQGFQATFESMLGESDVILSVTRLQQLVRRDQWRDALRYLSRFLPLDTERRPPLSVEAEVLHRFLAVHMALADIVAGTDESTVYCQLLSHDRLRSIIFSIFYARQQYRASIDWQRVRDKAADMVHDLVYRTPELKDLVYIPIRLVRPHQVLPIGFGFLRRSHSRNQIRRRFHSRNQTRRRRAYALARIYIKEQRSLPAISVPSQEPCDELSVSKVLDWVADIVDECLKAGKRPESHHVGPLQTSGTEGATAAPVLQTIFSSLTCPAINPGMPSVGATGGSKLASHVPTNGAPSLGTMCAGNSGVGLMANAGGIAAPVSQTTLGSMAHPAINPGMLSVANAVTNAGKLGNHVPTPGAPFLWNMRPPVSQTMLGSLTSRYGNSSVGLMANAGAPVSPAMQITNLASHAENSGAPAVRTTNLASHAENSGITKRLDKEGSNAESAHKILDPSKNAEEDLSILDEQGLHPQK